ncbi:FixH family protein [Virgibacillus flavescens]|uniref:FixH family protein n=1 Tax=Virgibacillus flavescens TaxID=1611422 RepID=UPI003D34903A
MKQTLFFIIIILVLSACGTNDESKNSTGGEEIKPIEVDLSVPESADKGDTVKLEVSVTQADKAVEDADEVEFEVWKDGAKEKNEMIKAKHEGKGVYTAEMTFEENAVYFVQSHVTARDMHTMPKTQIKIGKTDQNKSTSEQTNEKESHHHSNTAIDFQMPDKVSSAKASTYPVKVTHDDAPLKNALVRLEVWKDGSEKHNYVTLNESKDGYYQTDMTLQEQGLYHITVHVEKEDIHTHEEFKIEVK